MAQEARDERQLIRQRGAGSRNVTNPEFDLDFGGGSREERRLMRQRGAGNREVNNIDFGFAFATPVQLSSRVSRTRSKTPATSTRTSLRRNAVNTPLPRSSARSTRSQRLPATTTQRSINSTTSQPQRKRRRLSEVSNITRASSLDIAVASDTDGPEVPSNAQIPDTPRALCDVPQQRSNSAHLTAPSSPLYFSSLNRDEIEADKENISTTSEAVKAAVKKRKRKSIGQQSLFKKKRSSGASIVPPPIPLIIDEGLQTEGFPVNHSNLVSINNDSALHNDAPRELTLVSSTSRQPPKTISPIIQSPPRRRKKRRSIIGIRKKRKSNDSAFIAQTNNQPDLDIQHGEQPASVPESEHALDVDPNQGPSPMRRTSQRRPMPSPHNNALQADTHDEDADETYLPDENTPEPTPAPRRVKGNRRNRKDSSNSARTTIPSRKDDNFPILTHRMTNAHNLPTIFEEPEQNEPDDANDTVDELSLPPPAIMTRSAPNAVDVLAQVCRETADGYIRKLKEGPTDLSRTDRARQLTALQTFRSNLDGQLFDLSQSLDQRLHMEARLRKQRREKAELQARWLEVRKQRDRLDLRMDAVRRQHWEAEVLSRKAWNVSQFAHQLETAVSRDESDVSQESAADLLEFSLDQLKQDVSLKDGGGVLNVLRQFNAQLEQTARALS